MEIGDSSNPQNSLRSRARFNMDFLGETTSKSFEEIKIYLNSLSKKMQMDAVYSSAPESVVSLSELGSLSELCEACSQLEKLEPLVWQVKERKDGAKGRMHHLEVKQLLLLTYCLSIVVYLLLKAEGHAVQDHPVEGRLVEIKAMMEQMKQIEATKSADRLVNQSVVINVPTKTHESPVKISTHSAIDGSSKEKHNKYSKLSMEMLKVRAGLEAKLKQKGLYNVKNSKNESNQKNSSKTINQKNSSKPINKYLATPDDFDDEVQPVATGGKRSFIKLSKLIPDKGKKPKVFSGDEDLPVRDDIRERRRKHELRVLKNKQGGSRGDDDDDVDEDIQPNKFSAKRLGKEAMDIAANNDDGTSSENEFYKEVKRQRMEKLKFKAAKYSRTPRIPVAPPTLETEQDGRPVRRPITDEMWKNKGLTRYRKKRNKKNQLMKYKIKQIRQHKAMMARRAAPYGGEPGGIDPNLIRSIRLS